MLFYRLSLTLVAPALLGLALLRLMRGQEGWADLGQRLGLGTGLGTGTGKGTSGAIWLHGASNGELTAARPLIDALQADLPEWPVVVTANTVSGRDMVRSWQIAGVSARLAPFDLRLSLALFRRAWRPALLILLENELWANRIATSAAPVIMIGARLSEKTARRWARFPGLAQRLLHSIFYLWPQDPRSAAHFQTLGMAEARIGPVVNLKSDVTLAGPDPAELAKLAVHFDRVDTLLAASTHEGEEEIILQALLLARQTRPDLKLILAPRHPRRRAQIAALVTGQGLRLAVRSRQETPEGDVYLADTLGEMALWYHLAGTSFIGGSLCARGGHTPFEPAQAGSAILYGPDVANFREAYGRLEAGKAACQVRDAGTLAEALARLATGAEQTDLADKARAVLAGPQSDVPALIRAIRGFLKATRSNREAP